MLFFHQSAAEQAFDLDEVPKVESMNKLIQQDL